MRFQCLAVGHCSVTSSSGFMFIGPVLEEKSDGTVAQTAPLVSNTNCCAFWHNQTNKWETIRLSTVETLA